MDSMGIKKDVEVWRVKENGGSGSFVGIASNKSNWFIATELLEKHARLICELFNKKEKENV